MGVLTNDEAEMAAQGNSKAGSPWTTGIVVGVIVALVQVGTTQWANRSGSNDQLVQLTAEVSAMRKQLERIESRDFIPRAEYYRELTRLEDRLRELERQLQSSK